MTRATRLTPIGQCVAIACAIVLSFVDAGVCRADDEARANVSLEAAPRVDDSNGSSPFVLEIDKESSSKQCRVEQVFPIQIDSAQADSSSAPPIKSPFIGTMDPVATTNPSHLQPVQFELIQPERPAARQPQRIRVDNEVASPLTATPMTAGSAIAERIDASESLVLIRDRPTILRLKREPVRDQIGNPDLLSSLNISPTEYSLTGTDVGSTVLNFWFDSKDQQAQQLVSLLVRVIEDPDQLGQFAEQVKQLEVEINRSFPDSGIRLSVIGQQVVVRGQARDIEDAANILRLVATNVPGADADDTVSQLLASVQETGADSALLLNGNAVDAITRAGGLDAALSGQTSTGINAGRINSRIVNLLEVGGVQQVMLKVTVAEVNRTAARSIGADLSVTRGGTGFFSLLPGGAALGAAANGATLLVDRGNFDLALNALKSLDLARTLSEPTLTTLSGQPAQFQVGGSFPVPQITGFTDAGLQGVQFIPFGVQLQFVPTVTDDDRIRMILQTEVSSTNAGGGTMIGGSAVPGLDSSNFSTTVELRHGQTLAIAGLITTDTTSSSDRVPFFGSVPVLGRLFSSDAASYGESELVVLVTPYLAAPIDGDNPLPVPGSDYFEPSDLEFFLLGRLEGHHGEDYRTPTRAESSELDSFHEMHQKYIIGQPGYSPGLFDLRPTEMAR